MNNKVNSTCCGGDYTVPTKSIDQNAHQGSPSKRHNAAIEQEQVKNRTRAERRIKLAKFIGNYIHTKTNNTNDFTKLIYDAIGKFYYNE